MRTLLFFFTLTFFSGTAFSQMQREESSNEFITRYSNVNPKAQSQYKISPSRPVTSISIKYEGSLEQTFVVTNNSKYELFPDEHAEGPYSESALLIFDQPVTEFELLTGQKLITLHSLTTIHSPQIRRLSSRTTDESQCQEPVLIGQSSWRTGLPAPTGSRGYSTTGNLIVHHAASDNNLTDYTNVVRNIYLFHTQDRGWSDIGYNYLIAQNGDIYAGRDPRNGRQDEVIGAHFCGRNSGTMGVCLLGNLSLVPPTEEAMASLTDLLSWKTFSSEMNPLGINPHPLNDNLPVIAGHRDGCATQCPGNLAYPRLREIRNLVDTRGEQCNEPPVIEERVFAFGPNPTVSDILTVSLPENVIPEDLKFIDMNGKGFEPIITESDERSVQLSFKGIPKGVYIMKIKTDSFSATEKIIKL